MKRRGFCEARAALVVFGRAWRFPPMLRKHTLAARKRLAVRLLLASVVLALCPIATSQTVWDGPPIIFTRANGVDWTLEKNQDRITDIVWITRKNAQGIYNIATESGYSANSPADTEWAYGSAADWPDLTFQTWVTWAESNPPATIGQEAVVHLISQDIYIDITFLSWTCCAGGGGFSYERSTPAACPSDIDDSGDVGVKDLLFLLGAWGPCPPKEDCPADFDDSDDVGVKDLLILLGNWGPCP